MKKILLFLINFIPFKKYRKICRKKLEKPQTQISDFYGKIYMPYYPDVKFSDDRPEIYNKNGQRMEIFFIRDLIGCHCPYLDSSKYFLWDRFNIGLDTHFYTHSAILETMERPTHKYALFTESESIIPDDYKIFETHKGIEKDFDAVFTYSEKLLNTLDNAKFFPACATVWYGKEYYNGIKDSTILSPNVYLEKTKNLSMICSAKLLTEMHKIRHRFAGEFMKTGKVDIFGGFKDGKYFDYKSKTLKNYRFQVVVENDIAAYYFTEKILDCFASMTIPVYLGAGKIDEFFNPNGIIKINKNTSIDEILKICTEEEYEKRLDAVKENFQKVLKYTNIYNLLYETYFLEKQ